MSDSTQERRLRAEERVASFLEARLSGDRRTPQEFIEREPEVREEFLRQVRAIEGAGLWSPDDAVDPRRPTRFDGYELRRPLGSGGMGELYEAWQAALQRAVAIKFLANGVLMTPRAKSRFQREVEALARFAHPNIVRVFGTGSVEGQPYVAMELVVGEPLSRRIPRTDDLPDRAAVAQLVRWTIQIARALDHVHELGVIHRDVKPANILIDRVGHPTLIDFGLASTDSTDELTQSGEFVGTLSYAAPEQAFGERVDRRADVYGLAATLYHAATGVLPYPARSLPDLVRHFEKGPPSSASRLHRGVSRELGAVLACALSIAPRERYASCAEFADDLEAALEGRAIRAVPPSWSRKLLLRVRRRPGLSAALVFGTLVLAIAAREARTEWLARRARDQIEAARLRYIADASLTIDHANELLARSLELDPHNLDARLSQILRAARNFSAGLMQKLKHNTQDVSNARALLAASPELAGEPAGALLDMVLDVATLDAAVSNPDWQAPRQLPEPTSSAAALRLAVVWARLLRNPRRAEALCARVLESSPLDARANRIKCMYVAKDGSIEAVIAGRIALATPELDPVLLARNAVHEVRASTRATDPVDSAALVASAIEHAERAIELAADEPAILINAAIVFDECKRTETVERAIELYRHALELGAPDAARWNLLSTLMRNKRTQPADYVELCEPIEASYGANWIYWERLLWGYGELGRNDDAERAVRRALTRIPEHERYLARAALVPIELRRGDVEARERASQSFDECVRQAPTRAAALDALEPSSELWPSNLQQRWLELAIVAEQASEILGEQSNKLIARMRNEPPASR
ncbi:MAG: protein kinase [Planctomycetes bacterium]|nr:protein kinase [Planctomycetota bacterium]